MQRSEKFHLKAGTKYYLEAIHRQYHSGVDLQIGVHIYNTRYLEAQTGQAINELQQIIQTTTVQSEIQVKLYQKYILILSIIVKMHIIQLLWPWTNSVNRDLKWPAINFK